ncbi:hypothetical protein BURKHO8Y_140394 [Burkholderia sp. 8Y]|nr:hypothetical protein BURKHO8Y_140394 [Burkholderia sp. 8Y]
MRRTSLWIGDAHIYEHAASVRGRGATSESEQRMVSKMTGRQMLASSRCVGCYYKYIHECM